MFDSLRFYLQIRRELKRTESDIYGSVQEKKEQAHTFMNELSEAGYTVVKTSKA